MTLDFSPYQPFYLKCNECKNCWKVTKEYKDRSELIYVFQTQKEADKFCRDFVVDFKKNIKSLTENT